MSALGEPSGFAAGESADSASSGLANFDLGGVKSPYTEPLFKLLETEIGKPPTGEALTAPISLQCWETPGNDLYIGVEQRLSIHASLAQTEAVLDDFDHYKDLFPGYKDVHVQSRKADRLEIAWEQIVPVFFVPNVKYVMLYQVDTHDPTRVTYRYQLKTRGDLKVSDGFILISKQSDTLTSYVEDDFFDAEWGAAKVFGRDRIWGDTLEGIAESDLAVKLKAENPAWENTKARSESVHVLEKKWVDDCIKNRKLFVKK